LSYIRDAPFEEAMRVFYSPDPTPPLTHTLWVGDMGLCKHNIPCQVCFERHAIVGSGTWPKNSIQPCWECQATGWEIRKLSWLDKAVQAVRAFFGVWA
jgi:hypothetical protein